MKKFFDYIYRFGSSIGLGFLKKCAEPQAFPIIVSMSIGGLVTYVTSDGDWKKIILFKDIQRDLRKCKQKFNDIMYGINHDNVSDCTALLIGKLNHNTTRVFWSGLFSSPANHKDCETDYETKFNIAKHWYQEEYLPFQQKNLSIQDKNAHHCYQINIARRTTHDNFSNLKSILIEYSELRDEMELIRKKLGIKYERPCGALFTVGEAQKIFERYERFVQNTKPFDDVMGYASGDIYKVDEFIDAITNNLDHESRKKFVLSNVFTTCPKHVNTSTH